MCLLQINYKGVKCLHCDKDIGQYCESCYQILVAKNLKLQCELETYKQARREFEHSIDDKNQELIDKHIPRI